MDEEHLDPTFLYLDERLDEHTTSDCFEASLIQQRIPLFARIMHASKVEKNSIISNDTSEPLRGYYRICSLTFISKQHSTIEESISDSLNETKNVYVQVFTG